MKSRPINAREHIAYVLAIMLIQPNVMYVCLRVFHWSFFLSAILASSLAVGGAVSAVTALNLRRAK